MIVWLRIESDLITAVAYRTFGCPAAIASASIMCELVEGKAPVTVLALTEDDLVLALDGLPEGKGHCPTLAVTALHHALREA